MSGSVDVDPVLADPSPLFTKEGGSGQEGGPGRETGTSRRRKSTLREYIEALALAVLLALVIRSFVVQAFKIPSGSMLPTLEIGDHLLINKLRYGLRLPMIGGWLVTYDRPRPGDVIVFIHPVDRSKDFVKRVIATEGETLEIRDKRVFVDGQPRDFPEAYFVDGAELQGGARDNFGPVKVPENHVFVMGDNRDRSYDSRFWGFVDFNDVKGKAMLIYWSWDGRDRWVRWERIGAVIE